MSGKIAFGADQRLYINGGLAGSQAITLAQLSAAEIGEFSTHQADGGPVTIGRQSKSGISANRKFDGKIAEVLIYAADLSDNDRNKVQSYLAVKYGITLASDYLASDGTTLWASGGAHDNDIAGIGRDDASGLSNDQELPGAPALVRRLVREWKVADSNNVGAVTVTADMSALSLIGNYTVLLVDTDNDGDFTTGTPVEYSADSYSAGIAVFTDVALTNGNVFTLARTQTPPTASSVTFSGTLAEGYVLTGSYTYSDPNNDPESGSTYRWRRADDAVKDTAYPPYGLRVCARLQKPSTARS